MTIATAASHARLPWRDATDLAPALDTSRMRLVLADALDEAVNEVSVERTLFSKSRPVVIHYRYKTDGDTSPRLLIGELIGAEAQLHKAAEDRRLGKARRSQLDHAAASPLFLADSVGLVLRRPGFDSNLLGLRLLHDKAFAIETVANVIGQPLVTSAFHVSLKAHRLGKRAVLLVECKTASGASRRIYVRLRPTTYEAGHAAYIRHSRIVRAMQGATTVSIPSPLHFKAEWGAAFFEELPGTTPSFSRFGAGENGRLAGSALAEWRNLAPVADEQWSSHDEIAGLTSWSARLSQHLPRKVPAFDDALLSVSRQLNNLPVVRPVSCHRDFHEGQLLVDGKCCGILDFDTWCDADAGLDVGNFLAHIRLGELRSTADVSQFACSFVAAASEGQPLDFANRVAVWRRTALLRLAAIYAFTSEADHIVNLLAEEAAA